MLYLDGLTPVGPFSEYYAYVVIAFVLACWVLAMAVIVILPHMSGAELDSAESSFDVPVMAIANLLLFSFLLSSQLTAALGVILWERKIYWVEQIADEELRPWILGYIVAGILAVIIVMAIGKARTIASYIFLSAVPVSFLISSVMLFSIMWWSSVIDIELFSTMLTMAAMAAIMPLAAVGGILAVTIFIFMPLKWAYS